MGNVGLACTPVCESYVMTDETKLAVTYRSVPLPLRADSFAGWLRVFPACGMLLYLGALVGFLMGVAPLWVAGVLGAVTAALYLLLAGLVEVLMVAGREYTYRELLALESVERKIHVQALVEWIAWCGDGQKMATSKYPPELV